ncbi:hypothetical protein HW509_10795 [Asaia spathodeae]|uniref:hypothetical protein n=1 Tax=Asaia spathodeae TaxID=657016 RepID=UPI002FC2F43C
MPEVATQNNSNYSVLDLLKQHYPSQYYGWPSESRTTIEASFDVWNATGPMGTIDVSSLPAASSLAPLTAEQYALAQGALNVWIDSTTLTLTYPARYYARYDTSAAQPTGVTGWFDAWDMSTVDGLAAASEMIPLTTDQWAVRMTGPQGVKDGALVDYTPPVVALPIKQQAQNEMAWISGQASMASAMGETFTADMKSYVKAVQAIANGTDTVSEALPPRPADIMS